jgi:hypothetical protein
VDGEAVRHLNAPLRALLAIAFFAGAIWTATTPDWPEQVKALLGIS